MIKRLLLVSLILPTWEKKSILFLSPSLDSYTIRRENNTVDYGCSPHPVYISWLDIHPYVWELVNDTNSSLLFRQYKTAPLRVMKCLNSLTPCESRKGECGLEFDGYSSISIPITDNLQLHLKYVEAKGCRCYQSNCNSRKTDAPPFIVEAKFFH